MVSKAFRPGRSDCPDPTRVRRKRAQSEQESATRRAMRVARKRAIPICVAAALTRGHGRQSLPPASIGLPRSDTRAKKAGTKQAGISDAARHAIRQGEGNPDLHRRSLDLRSWSLKPSARRTGAGSFRHMREEAGTKRAGISVGAHSAFAAEKAMRFAPPHAACRFMAPNALILHVGSGLGVLDQDVSVHHGRLEDTDHRRVRRLAAQVPDAMRHIATVAQGLARRCGSHRVADVDL